MQKMSDFELGYRFNELSRSVSFFRWMGYILITFSIILMFFGSKWTLGSKIGLLIFGILAITLSIFKEAELINLTK